MKVLLNTLSVLPQTSVADAMVRFDPYHRDSSEIFKCLRLESFPKSEKGFCPAEGLSVAFKSKCSIDCQTWSGSFNATLLIGYSNSNSSNRYRAMNSSSFFHECNCGLPSAFPALKRIDNDLRISWARSN